LRDSAIVKARRGFTREEVDDTAAMLRGGLDAAARGPVAIVVDPARSRFADSFAEPPRAIARSGDPGAFTKRGSG